MAEAGLLTWQRNVRECPRGGRVADIQYEGARATRVGRLSFVVRSQES
jgi:hypothetical protein